MSPLDHRHFALLVQEGQPIAPVVDYEAEDSEALGHTELVRVCCFRDCCVMLQHHRVVGVQHDELQLNIVGDVGSPLAIHFLFQVNVELDEVFNLVVLRIRALFNGLVARTGLTLFIVAEITGT